MNWFLIVLLSLFGQIMGLLAVKGYTQRVEPILWILLGMLTALVLSRNLEDRMFFHALIIGLFWGILNSLNQFIFFEQYLLNNPAARQGFSKLTLIQPRLFTLVAGMFFGMGAGMVLAGLTLFIKKLW